MGFVLVIFSQALRIQKPEDLPELRILFLQFFDVDWTAQDSRPSIPRGWGAGEDEDAGAILRVVLALGIFLC